MPHKYFHKHAQLLQGPVTCQHDFNGDLGVKQIWIFKKCRAFTMSICKLKMILYGAPCSLVVAVMEDL